MSTTEERRADGIQRVPVEALVEVCGVGAKQTPFEAESADVSGRGIRLRTAYLPETGAPVVCRFENAGREVIAEGVVAWCQKETRGGEFGVRFTALDARSADTLRDLCGLAPSTQDPAIPDQRAVPTPVKVAPGAKVKLHIEGLGSPMRARIDEGKGSHISVGSSLEFLRIGRKLEMESIEDGSRRDARIEGLDVMVDPSSGVPRLVVLLKTDSDEATPQPSVVDASRNSAGRVNTASAAPRSARPQPKPAEPDTRDDRADAENDPTDEQIDAMVGRVRRIAGATRRKLTQAGLHLGGRLGPGVGSAMKRVWALSQKSEQPPPRRKTTAAPPTAPTAERKLRPQMRSVDSEAEPVTAGSTRARPRLRRIASGIGVTGVLGTVIAVALHGPSEASSPRSKTDAVVQGPGARSGTEAMSGAESANASEPGSNMSSSGSKLVVNVPLFGSTTMATLERAPVPAASNESLALVAAREQALAKAAQAALAQGVDASKLSEDPNASSTDKSEEPGVKPEDIAPFGHGRMKDPILYRLKLDAPGEALRGTSSSKGFSVVIPGRQLLESPNGFVKRDPRFLKITSTQSSDGAKLTWQFKDEAPPFRVRLRKSAVEILISEAVKPGEKAK
ncbi:MAG TPA: PilZ domain-containing protein [Polyangiaceae bacterium]|nr:PilZ domain-containing protein [Polyangiaceae bacterium]